LLNSQEISNIFKGLKAGGGMLDLTFSAQAYFREALCEALRCSKINISESTQAYVVYLLSEFSRTDKAFSGVDHGEEINMVILLERAFLATDREALEIFRYMGDTSLYLVGFFGTKNRLVSKSYYKDMGGMAYAYASDLSRAYGIKSADIFQELSERFPDMVLVLENIRSYGERQEKYQS
jgi:hypothetical protein